MSETSATKSNRLERLFPMKERGSNPRNEILGGLVTFLAMCYILPVNAAILSSTGMNAMGVFASTAIVSALVTLLMGFLANYPISLSAGMGLNAYLAYTVCGTLGYSWQEALLLLTITGILFFIFSLTPVRRHIIEAFPDDLKKIISAGLGAFIAFVGLKGAGIVVASSGTLVSLGSLSDPVVLLALGGIFLAFVLMNLKTKKGILASLAVPLAMLAVALMGLLLRACGLQNAGLPSADFTTHWGVNNFLDVAFYGLFSGDPNVKTGGDFLQLIGALFSNPASYVIMFSLIFVNLFDTSATLMAIGRDVPLFDEQGHMKNNRAILADATGALICGPLGTATVTSFVESTIGVKLGARTGLAAVTAGLLFLLSAFIYPVFEIFTYSCVSACALVSVGALIFAGNLEGLRWKDPEIGFSAFITILMIILTYSLTNGIGFGLFTYCLILLAKGKGKEVSWILYAVAGFYVLSFTLNEVLSKLA